MRGWGDGPARVRAATISASTTHRVPYAGLNRIRFEGFAVRAREEETCAPTASQAVAAATPGDERESARGDGDVKGGWGGGA